MRALTQFSGFCIKHCSYQTTKAKGLSLVALLPFWKVEIMCGTPQRQEVVVFGIVGIPAVERSNWALGKMQDFLPYRWKTFLNHWEPLWQKLMLNKYLGEHLSWSGHHTAFWTCHAGKYSKLNRINQHLTDFSSSHSTKCLHLPLVQQPLSSPCPQTRPQRCHLRCIVKRRQNTSKWYIAICNLNH